MAVMGAATTTSWQAQSMHTESNSVLQHKKTIGKENRMCTNVEEKDKNKHTPATEYTNTLLFMSLN